MRNMSHRISTGEAGVAGVVGGISEVSSSKG